MRAPAARDDDALIAAARDGDQAAFTALFRRHGDRVRTQLTRLIGPVADRDDLVQQVFLGLHRALPTYRGEASLATYLHRVTVNAAYDHLRARKRRKDDETDAIDDDELAGSGPNDGRDHAEARSRLSRMFALLRHLDPDKRIAFVLVAVEGLSLAEAAALVGASPDAVKQRALAARRDLTFLIERDARRGEPR
jgi:RNA polymerase sigma-70 factor, ECF subfamily